MYRDNPKQAGSNLIDCTPQRGPCPMNCSNCYYNRDKSLHEPNIPSKKASEGKIVRMNALHDSNVQRALVLRTAKRYKHKFFNTSIADFDAFSDPIVYTANSCEEEPVDIQFLRAKGAEKLMFVRLRVSPANLHHIKQALGLMRDYSDNTPIMLTFMRYYSYNESYNKAHRNYVWGKHIMNWYWSPTRGFKRRVLKMARAVAGKQVTMCGALDSDYCRDCRNCESYYQQACRYLEETADAKKGS